MITSEVFQGDTSDIVTANVTLSGALVTNLAGYAATLSLSERIGGAVVVSVNMEAQDGEFRGRFLPVHTQALDGNRLYYGIVEVKNESIDYNKETHFGLYIKTQGKP